MSCRKARPKDRTEKGRTVFVTAIGQGAWVTLPKVLTHRDGTELQLKPGTILYFSALTIREYTMGGDGTWSHIPHELRTVRFDIRGGVQGIVIPPGSIETELGKQGHPEKFVPLQLLGQNTATVVKVPR